MSLHHLMAQRRARIEEWRALGCEPYAYRFDATHHATDLLAKGDAVTEEPGEHVRVAGRLVAKRGQGKAGFGHVLDGSGRIHSGTHAAARADALKRVPEWLSR